MHGRPRNRCGLLFRMQACDTCGHRCSLLSAYLRAFLRASKVSWGHVQPLCLPGPPLPLSFCVHARPCLTSHLTLLKHHSLPCAQVQSTAKMMALMAHPHTQPPFQPPLQAPSSAEHIPMNTAAAAFGSAVAAHPRSSITGAVHGLPSLEGSSPPAQALVPMESHHHHLLQPSQQVMQHAQLQGVSPQPQVAGTTAPQLQQLHTIPVPQPQPSPQWLSATSSGAAAPHHSGSTAVASGSLAQATGYNALPQYLAPPATTMTTEHPGSAAAAVGGGAVWGASGTGPIAAQVVASGVVPAAQQPTPFSPPSRPSPAGDNASMGARAVIESDLASLPAGTDPAINSPLNTLLSFPSTPPSSTEPAVVLPPQQQVRCGL